MDRYGNKTLGVCMIVKNEEANLPNILSDIKSFSDETVIVDTGSSDNSVNIARGSGAVLIEDKWSKDFSRARNVSIGNCTTDWIIWVDADDRISPVQGLEIKKLINGAFPNTCYRLKILNINPDGRLAPFMQLRLFPNDTRIRFVNRIHESVAYAAQNAGYDIKDTSIEIRHSGYSSHQLLRQKILRNLEYLKDELDREPFNITARFAYANSLCEVGKLGEALVEFQRILTEKNASEVQPDVYHQSFTEVARLYHRMGEVHKALMMIEKAVKINPDDFHTIAVAGDIYFKNNNNKMAERFFKKALSIEYEISSIPIDYNGIRLYCIKNLCDLLLRQNRYKAVERILYRETDRANAGYEPWLLLGDYYIALNRIREGIDTYETGLELFPMTEILQQRLRKQGKVDTVHSSYPDKYELNINGQMRVQ